MALKDIVGKLTEMNKQGNLADDSLRPDVEYQVTDHYSAKMKEIADHFRSMGMQSEARSIYGKMGAIKAGSNRILAELGREEAEKAKTIEREMVGHGRSGYVPTGNLMRSIKAHTLEDGRVQIYPEAETKRGTEYGGYVEYGTRRHPTPEPYMYQSYKEMKPAVKQAVDNLMKGMSANG